MRGLAWALALVSSIGCAPTEPMPEPAPSPDQDPTQSQDPVAVTEAAEPPIAEPPIASGPLPEDSPVCDARAIAGARKALEAAIANGVDAAFLAGCEPEQIVCEAELERSPSCRMIARGGEDHWQIVIIPQPATGAPTRIEIWTAADGQEASRVQVSGSTFGLVEGVTIEGFGRYKSHTHGGAPARIGGAEFTVENHRDQPIELKLLGTRWLTAHSCEVPRTERSRPKPAGLAIEPDLVDGKMTVTIPSRTNTTVSLGHEAQEAYMAYCDRFATAARFEIGGKAVEVIAEHRVIRRQPLRDP